MSNTSSSVTLRPCTAGYRLHCSDARFQLYNKGIGNTFVFIQRAPSMSGFELMTSIALQKKITKGDDVLYTWCAILSDACDMFNSIKIAAWSSSAYANHCSRIACSSCVQPRLCCTSIVNTVRSFLIRFKTVVSQMQNTVPTEEHLLCFQRKVHFIGILVKKMN